MVKTIENLQFAEMMRQPSIETELCAICKVRKATNRHHIVPRSQGGENGPTITVCGMGNASGCHGLLHAHKLHIRWGVERISIMHYGDHDWDFEEGWQVLYTPHPTKYADALEMEGWRWL